MAVWSHGVSVPLVAVLVVVYLGVRLRRERAHLWRDLALLVASALVATGLLAICSKLLLGQFDFITPTVNVGEVAIERVRATCQPFGELELGSLRALSARPAGDRSLVLRGSRSPAVAERRHDPAVRRSHRCPATSDVRVPAVHRQRPGSGDALLLISALVVSQRHARDDRGRGDTIVPGARRRGAHGSTPHPSIDLPDSRGSRHGSSSLCRRSSCWRSR